jgi:very-short-patch-repair endonuclease
MNHDALRKIYAHAAGHDAVFTIDDARRAGMTAGQIDRCVAQTWVVLYDGVYAAPGAPLTWKSFLRAACLAGGPRAVASHGSAALLYGVPGGREAPLEVTCPRWLRTKCAGVVVHERTRVLPGDTQVVDGIPVVRPELLVLQLAGRVRSPAYVERILQSMRRKRLLTPESVSAVFARHARRGVRGVRVLRAALAGWDSALAPTESEAETTLLQLLRAHGFRDVVTQHEVFDAAGRFVARLDLAIPGARVGIEYDSDEWHADELSLARDSERRSRAFAAGWTILTVRRLELRRGAPELVRALRARVLASRDRDMRGIAAQGA